MEIIREVGPFAVGMALLYPFLMMTLRKLSDHQRTLGGFLGSFSIGLIWSFLVGEQSGPEWIDRFIPIMVDSCLAYTGFSLAQWFFRPRLTSA